MGVGGEERSCVSRVEGCDFYIVDDVLDCCVLPAAVAGLELLFGGCGVDIAPGGR